MLSRATLIKRKQAGEHFGFLYFWGHTMREGGTVTKACLSQWFPSKFQIDGQEYPTAEHWMMASKARMFNDENALSLILADPRPIQAKKHGRTVQGFDSQRWASASVSIVIEGNRAKFSQNERLKNYLLATGNQVLVEASPEDRIWGIGLAENDPRAHSPEQWPGENLLGFALMEVRQQLRVTLCSNL